MSNIQNNIAAGGLAILNFGLMVWASGDGPTVVHPAFFVFAVANILLAVLTQSLDR